MPEGSYEFTSYYYCTYYYRYFSIIIIINLNNLDYRTGPFMRTKLFMSWHYAYRIIPLSSNFQYLPTSRANYCLIILIYISYLISLSMVNPCDISHTVPSVIASIYFTSLFIVGHLTFQSYNCSIHCCFHVISQMRSSPSFDVSQLVSP